jgi:hypothetical protein
MYNEKNIVQLNVHAIRAILDDAKILVVQSDSGQSIEYTDFFKVVPNLHGTVDAYKLPAAALSRNYSILFNELYSSYPDVDYIIALTGDTLITNIYYLKLLCDRMTRENKVMAVSQAIGQDFHSSTANPPELCGGRIQHEGLMDFMPQLFIVDGKFAYSNKLFSQIPITNEFTSEQCLGDELSKYTDKSKVLVFSKTAYGYKEGIQYQVKNI